MNNFITESVALVGAKFLTILTSLTMAVIAVGIDAKRHSVWSAIFAIFAGTVVGVIAASAITALFGWDERVGYGIASIAAVTSNNLIKWLLRLSQDPTSIIRLWLGRGKE